MDGRAGDTEELSGLRSSQTMADSSETPIEQISLQSSPASVEENGHGSESGHTNLAGADPLQVQGPWTATDFERGIQSADRVTNRGQTSSSETVVIGLWTEPGTDRTPDSTEGDTVGAEPSSAERSHTQTDATSSEANHAHTNASYPFDRAQYGGILAPTGDLREPLFYHSVYDEFEEPKGNDGCKHGKVVRQPVIDQYEACDTCGRVPALGWLYQCAVDTPEIGGPNEPRPDEMMSPSVAAAIKAGEYTLAERETLIFQKLNVFRRAREAQIKFYRENVLTVFPQMHITRGTEQAQDTDHDDDSFYTQHIEDVEQTAYPNVNDVSSTAQSTAAAQQEQDYDRSEGDMTSIVVHIEHTEHVDVSQVQDHHDDYQTGQVEQIEDIQQDAQQNIPHESSPTFHGLLSTQGGESNTQGADPPKPLPRCTYRACQRCSSRLLERTWQSLDGICKPSCPVPCAFDLRDREPVSARTVSNLGLRPNPSPTPDPLPRFYATESLFSRPTVTTYRGLTTGQSTSHLPSYLSATASASTPHLPPHASTQNSHASSSTGNLPLNAAVTSNPATTSDTSTRSNLATISDASRRSGPASRSNACLPTYPPTTANAGSRSLVRLPSILSRSSSRVSESIDHPSSSESRTSTPAARSWTNLSSFLSRAGNRGSETTGNSTSTELRTLNPASRSWTSLPSFLSRTSNRGSESTDDTTPSQARESPPAARSTVHLPLFLSTNARTSAPDSSSQTTTRAPNPNTNLPSSTSRPTTRTFITTNILPSYPATGITNNFHGPFAHPSNEGFYPPTGSHLLPPRPLPPLPSSSGGGITTPGPGNPVVAPQNTNRVASGMVLTLNREMLKLRSKLQASRDAAGIDLSPRGPRGPSPFPMAPGRLLSARPEEVRARREIYRGWRRADRGNWTCSLFNLGKRGFLAGIVEGDEEEVTAVQEGESRKDKMEVNAVQEDGEGLDKDEEDSESDMKVAEGKGKQKLERVDKSNECYEGTSDSDDSDEPDLELHWWGRGKQCA